MNINTAEFRDHLDTVNSVSNKTDRLHLDFKEKYDYSTL